MKKELNTVDLFCGAGGATTGMELALAQLGLVHKGIAINHWQVAVDTMSANHPDVETKRMSIEEAVPAELVPGGVVDLLWASPSCTHHSRAKGGKPRSNQLRAQPELVLTWLDQLFVRRIIIENVPEFVQWGPLGRDGKPIKRKAGACFAAWVEGIRARNYDVEWRVVNCADYGDATSRRRFFLKAVRKGCGRICWPEPTHARNPEPDLFGHTLKKWRGVKECLDLNDLGKSIFNRKNPLAANTLRRIAVGLKRYNGIEFQMDMLGSDRGDESRVRPLTDPLPPQHAGGNRSAVVRPFIVKLNNHANAEDIEEPLTSVLAGGQHHALCTPFIVRANRGCYAESVDEPLSSQQAHTVHHALCQPLVLDHFKNGEATDGSEPLGSQTTHDRYSMVTPFIVEHRKNGQAKPLDEPIGAQTTKDKFSLCTPFVVNNNAHNVPKSLDDPAPALTTGNHAMLCTPLVIGQNGGAQAHPVTDPCPTIPTKGAVRVATPLIVDMSHPGDPNDDGRVSSGDEPLKTITTSNNLAVVNLPQLPDGRYLDIRIRMLKPSELAAAHSFPKDYVLTGNRTEQVKQIGNSVPVMTAAAMCRADLEAS